jgi:CHAT domain-containing protein
MYELFFCGPGPKWAKYHRCFRGFALLVSCLALSAISEAQTAAELLAQAEKLADQGDRYRAGPFYARAEEQFRAAGDRRNELYAKFGRLHSESDHGNYKSVGVEVERDLATSTVQRDPRLKIQALAVKGLVDLNIDAPSAELDWKQVLETAVASGNAKWENRARGELGIVAGLNGNIGEAGMALFKAVATAEKIGDASGAINFTIWLANGMALNGMAEGALKQLEKASQLAQRSGYQRAPFLLSIARLRAIANLTEPERSQRMMEARSLFESTLRLAQDEKVFGAEIELLNQNGQLELAVGNNASAEASFSRAASVAQSAELSGLAAEALLQLARLYLQTGRLREASLTIERGIKNLGKVKEGYDLPLFVAAQADTEAALGRLTTADALYARATTLLEGLLVNAPSSIVKSSMIGAFSQIYVSHFRFAWTQLHDSAKAFRIIESARGRVLLDSIHYAQRSPSIADASPAEIKIARLQRTLLDRRLDTMQTERTLARLDAAYDELGTSQFAQERKEVRTLRQPPVALSVFANQLRPEEVFVEYVLDRNASYALEISRAGMAVHKLPPTDQIARLTKIYLAGVKLSKDERVGAQGLYSVLLGPILKRPWKSLIVVPDGSLHLLPFEALQDENGTYLVERLAVSTVPSATVLATLKREQQVGASKEFLGVAFSPQTSEAAATGPATRGIADIRGANLTPLPFSREEVSEANAALGGRGVILQGADASEAALKSQPLAEYRVIHLAAHGLGDEATPDRAAIVLAPGNSSEDGLWQAREIRHTRLNADTVVLSACETGTGRLQGQEGIMNLARAFIGAGAKSVVASLWSVEDRSTATLMEGFYEHLAQGESVSDALRSSQLDFIKTYGPTARPYQWAGFEVIGDGARTIVTTTKQSEQ